MSISSYIKVIGIICEALLMVDTYVIDMLSGRTETRYLVYSTGKGFYPIPGGFASRIKGITTVFFLALLTSK